MKIKSVHEKDDYFLSKILQIYCSKNFINDIAFYFLTVLKLEGLIGKSSGFLSTQTLLIMIATFFVRD